MNTPNPLLARLRHHVTGAIERGEAVAIVEQPTFPALLRSTRAQLGFSQGDLASVLGCSVWAIRAWERGDPMRQPHPLMREAITARLAQLNTNVS